MCGCGFIIHAPLNRTQAALLLFTLALEWICKFRRWEEQSQLARVLGF